MMRRRQAARGFALMEILISLVILMFGLLGLVGISSRTHMSEVEAYQRVLAQQLVQDMADRLNANRKVATCYSNGVTGTQFGAGYTGTPTCTAGAAQEQARAVADLKEWDGLLKNTAVTTKDGGSVVGMIGAVGCVTLDDASKNIYLVAVAWQGLNKTAAPLLADGKTAFPCGSGSYADEKLHRVVTTKVRMGALS